MNNYQVDLTNCDREPIHIPGKVQSHGFLVAVDAKTYSITYISENIKDFINNDAKNYLGKNINELENILKPAEPKDQLTQLLNLGAANKNYESVNPFNIELNGEPYFVIVTPSGSNLVLEFEPMD